MRQSHQLDEGSRYIGMEGGCSEYEDLEQKDRAWSSCESQFQDMENIRKIERDERESVGGEAARI